MTTPTGTNGNGHARAGAPPADDPRLRAANDLVQNVLSSRVDWLREIMDPRRDIEDECGYPRLTDSVNIEMYRQLWERESIAARVVEVMPLESWQTQPLVYEDEDADTVTDFELAWDQLGQTIRGTQSWYQEEAGSAVWEHLRRADVLSGIGHFGLLMLGVDDGRGLETPLEGVVTANESYMMAGEEDAIRGLPKLTRNEERVIDGWAAHRKRVENRVRCVPVEIPPGISPQDFRQAVENQFGYVPGLLPPNTSAPDFTSATGGQYLAGFGDAAPLAGTDQQYFGVQFGPSEPPATAPAKGPRKLLFLRCFDESLVQIVRYEWNIRNPRFGAPVMYRITLNDPREQHSGVGLPLATVFVHWSRVIHLADNLASSEIFGIPRMRPVLNNLLGLRKLYAGSPEMYWRGAFPGIKATTHPQLGGDVNVDIAGMQNTFEQYFNGLQRYLLGIGMDFNTLAPTVVDPTAQIAVQIEAICIKLGIPVRVFKGSERGELASTQDDSKWNDRVRGRQNGYVTPRVIVPFIDRLISIGVLPEPKKGAKGKPTRNQLIRNAAGKVVGVKATGGYSVEWPDLDSLSDKDKAAILLQRTQAYAAYVTGNVEQVVQPKDYMTRFDNLTEEEADAILDEADKAADQEDKENQALAKKHGFKPAPPPGFKAAPPPAPPPGAPAAGAPPGGAPPQGQHPPGAPPAQQQSGQPPPAGKQPQPTGQKPSPQAPPAPKP